MFARQVRPRREHGRSYDPAGFDVAFEVEFLVGRTRACGADGRDVVFMHADDAAAMGLAAGVKVMLESIAGTYGPVRVLPIDIRRGNLAVYFPEANVLVPRTIDPSSRTPVFKSVAVRVVRAADPARTVADLQGYRIFFGPADCDEKSAAPMALLTAHGIEVSREPETCPACSDAATKLLELDENVQAAAVISSYAQPLLEGCGTIEKGDLRVLGESEVVPFITAFINAELDEAARQQIHDVLMEVQYDVNAMIALETKSGFVPYAELTADEDAVAAAKKKN